MTFGSGAKAAQQNQEAVDEERDIIQLPDEHWERDDIIEKDEPAMEEIYCGPGEIYVEHENANAFSWWLILANKFRHRGGYSADKGIPWHEADVILSRNYYKKKKKKKLRNLINDILLIESGAIMAENKKLSQD